MSDDPDFEQPDDDGWADTLDDAPEQTLISKKAQQDIAHDRGRICKKRGCAVCSPLVAQRKAKKKERQAEAQALAHSKGKPCGRTTCELDVCKHALAQAAAAAPPVEPPTKKRAAAQPKSDDPQADLELLRYRQAEKHRVGLACGLEDCAINDCVVGFANERKRRHRKNRPCRSATCTTPMCVAARSAH